MLSFFMAVIKNHKDLNLLLFFVFFVLHWGINMLLCNMSAAAIATGVTVAEILKNNGLAVEKSEPLSLSLSLWVWVGVVI